jgi:hypothetical protein
VGKWGVFETDDDEGFQVHVIPIGDLMGHIESPRCACRPEITEEGAILHNAWDERE